MGAESGGAETSRVRSGTAGTRGIGEGRVPPGSGSTAGGRPSRERRRIPAAQGGPKGLTRHGGG